MIKRNIVLLLLIFTILSFFSPVFLKQLLPVPADTIVGLYHPFRDTFSKTNPNGIAYKNFLITDPVRQQYPWRYLSIEIEKTFHLPLWNPYNFTGTPLFANFQTGALNPFNIFFFILPFTLSWSMLILLQPLLAAVFMYLFARHLQISTYGAFLSGVVFAFCGFATAWLEWGTILQTLLWLPLILLATDKYFSFADLNKNNSTNLFIIKNTKWGVLLLLAFILSLVAGHLQTFVYCVLVFLLYFLARCYQFHAWRKIIPLIFFTFLCAAVTIIIWYPSLQYISLSARDVYQLDNWKIAGWFIPWSNLIQFIAPDFFGNPATLNYWGVWNYAEFVGYVGIFPLLMVFIALLMRRDKKTIFFGFVFLASLFFAVQTFISEIPYSLHLPFFSASQPTRLLAIVDFSLALLAGFGFDVFLRDRNKRLTILIISLFGFLFLIIWIYLYFGSQVSFGLPADKAAIAKHNFYFPSLLYILSVVLSIVYVLFVSKFKSSFKNIVIILFILLTIFDLMRFSNKFNTFTKKEYLFPQTNTLNYLMTQQQPFRIMTTDDRILPPNFGIMYKLQSIDGYDPLYLKSYAQLIAAMQRNKPNIEAPYGFNRIITPHNLPSRFVDLIGVKYILTLSEFNDPHYKKVLTEGSTMIYENKNVFPRAFFVSEVIPSSNTKDAITKLFDEKYNLHQQAIVLDWNNQTTKFSLGNLSIASYSENQIQIKTQNGQEGFLVVTDAYYPTWKAYICDESGFRCAQTKIYKTNYNYRGIVVSPGKHTIKFAISLI